MIHHHQDVYVINLETRPDRWEEFNKGITKFKTINPIRFNAISHQQGFIGCAMSHITLIEMAKEKGLPFVVVMEDDTKITHKDFDHHFTRILDYLKGNGKWEIFNGNPSCCNERPQQKVMVVNNDPKMVSFEFGYTTNFMIYSHRSYDKIIALRDIYKKGANNRSHHAIDVLYNKMSRITHLPYLTGQRAGMSDIEKRCIAYDGFINGAGQRFLQSKIA